MATPVQRRATCRLCDQPHLELVLKLTPTPPANAFVPKEKLRETQPTFPLDVHLCRDCGHVQLLDIVDPEVLFGDYVYVSGTSPVFVEHFRQYARHLVELVQPAPGALVVEIGSNDGTLLRFFQQAGLRVLGIDPAREIARRATADGIETMPTFFNSALARQIRQERGPAAIVAANNVFAHMDDLADVTRGVAALLDDEGVFVFEVSYLLDVLTQTLFDTMYHEHLSYHALKPLVPFFRRFGLEVFHAERVAPHGGSLRCFVRRAAGRRPVTPAVAALLAEEDRHQLDRPETFRRFSADIDAVKQELSALLRRLKREGKSVAGYGAPAKATTLLYHFALADALEYIVDDSPLKQNLFSPGTHIPVVSSRAITERRPDYLLILAWNFAQPIMAKYQDYLNRGGHFIVPLPKCQVY